MHSIFNKGLLIVLVFLVVSISNAKAVPIGSVISVPGGPIITDFVGVGLSSSGITFGGGPTGVASGGSFASPFSALLNSGSLVASGPSLAGGTFSVLNPFAIFPPDSLFLSGSFLDVKENIGSIEALFSVTGGAAAGEFGSLVVLSLMSPTFAPGTIAGLPLLSNVNSVSASLTISSVVAVVSVPGSLYLLLTGLCFLIVVSSVHKKIRFDSYRFNSVFCWRKVRWKTLDLREYLVLAVCGGKQGNFLQS